MSLVPYLQRVANRENLSSEEASAAMLAILEGEATTAQIAALLFVSENTIKTHIRHILEKLDASNRAEAVSKANQLGLIHQD